MTPMITDAELAALTSEGWRCEDRGLHVAEGWLAVLRRDQELRVVLLKEGSAQAPSRTEETRADGDELPRIQKTCTCIETLTALVREQFGPKAHLELAIMRTGPLIRTSFEPVRFTWAMGKTKKRGHIAHSHCPFCGIPIHQPNQQRATKGGAR